MICAVRGERRERVIVIGGGLAGAACAAAIARRGRPVLLLEAEEAMALHSTGRSAGLVRLAVEDPALAPLCREGGRAIAEREVGFARTGSVLIDPSGRIPDAVRSEVEHRPIPPDELRRRFPWLAGAALEGAIECPNDGVVDPRALVASLIEETRGHGGEVRLGERAVAPILRDERVVGVQSECSEHAGSDLIVATGAWGAVWGRLGGVPIALAPTRRSLVRTDLPENSNRSRGARGTPWVWQIEEGWYFRADGEELIWSAGEEIPDLAGAAEEDDAAPRRLRSLVARRLPTAGALEIRGHRSGHRTHLPDRRFLLGPDPRCAGWHWAVGLGGHGITAALACGDRVALALLREGEPIDPRLAFRADVLPTGPERLATRAVAAAVV